jgi:hypothetical protein
VCIARSMSNYTLINFSTEKISLQSEPIGMVLFNQDARANACLSCPHADFHSFYVLTKACALSSNTPQSLYFYSPRYTLWFFLKARTFAPGERQPNFLVPWNCRNHGVGHQNFEPLPTPCLKSSDLSRSFKARAWRTCFYSLDKMLFKARAFKMV